MSKVNDNFTLLYAKNLVLCELLYCPKNIILAKYSVKQQVSYLTLWLSKISSLLKDTLLFAIFSIIITELYSCSYLAVLYIFLSSFLNELLNFPLQARTALMHNHIIC